VFLLDLIAHVGVTPSQNLKLFSREIIIPTYVKNVPKRHRRTDGQTDGRTDGRTDDLPWQNRALRSIRR